MSLSTIHRAKGFTDLIDDSLGVGSGWGVLGVSVGEAERDEWIEVESPGSATHYL